MVSTWTRRSTTLEMKGILVSREVPCSDLRDSMTALIWTFLLSTIGSDEVTLERGAGRDQAMNDRELASLVDGSTHECIGRQDQCQRVRGAAPTCDPEEPRDLEGCD